MLLTCPTCRSGLQVPDGTTAMVRCPACKAVFSAADGAAPEAIPVAEAVPVAEAPRPPAGRSSGKHRRLPAAAAEPRRRARPRDDDADDRRPARRKPRPSDDDGLSPAERLARAQRFARGMWGARLVWVSFICYIVSLLVLIAFYLHGTFEAPPAGYLTAAGLLGLFNWILAGIGVGLCLAGETVPGHWRFGIGAAVAVVVHGILLAALVNKGNEYSAGTLDGGTDATRWGLVPTRLDTLLFYLTFVLYPDQTVAPSAGLTLSMITGLAEMVRTVFVMMFLSCLARAAGENEVSHRCTRAAGYAAYGPGAMAVGMLAFVAVMTETNAAFTTFSRIVLLIVMMGIYALLAAFQLPSLLVSRDTAEACEFPFESQQVHLGG